mmetsp:Transcript_29592/g.69555  ORF Transcript_29592/g.69555 Transcript_29592/m.69555 type:complete len:276 (+) Transcript_29592:718-1545(+)
MSDEEMSVAGVLFRERGGSGTKNLFSNDVGDPLNRRWLENLTANDLVGLVQLRRRVADLASSGTCASDTSDIGLVRFLRACRHDVDAAESKLRAAAKWRVDMQVDEMTQESVASELRHNRFIVSPLRTTNGEPIWLVVPRRHTPDPATLDDVERAVVFLVEQTLATLPHPAHRFTAIVDCSGVSLSQLDSHLVRRVADLLQSYYPERLGQVLVINEPWYIRGVWNLLRHILDDATTRRFRFLGTSYGAVLESVTGTSSIDRLFPLSGKHSPPSRS